MQIKELKLELDQQKGFRRGRGTSDMHLQGSEKSQYMIFPEFPWVLEQNGAYFPWEITEIMHIFPASISKLIGDMSNAIFIR